MINEKDTVKRKYKLSLWEKIMLIILLLLLLLAIFCVILFVRINDHERKLDMLIEYVEAQIAADSRNDALTDVNATGQNTEGVISAGNNQGAENTTNGISSDMEPDDLTTEAYVQETEGNSETGAEPVSKEPVYSEEQIEEALVEGRKVVYLTFDDGPSNNTDAILDILNEYGVKASFFVVGKDAYKYGSQYQRIVEEGHTIAMHSYSHVYDEIYAGLENFEADFNKISCHIELLTGVVPKIYRFPGGSSNQVSDVPMTDFVRYLNDRGITYFDWNVSSRDAQKEIPTVEQIVENVFYGIEKEDVCVVLMHDADERVTTVEALPSILERLQEMDAVILPITENTQLIQHIDSTTVK